ncbi:rab9, putative [Entamoeba invadens IP1]|uniref:Rab9, putative n=1 Tax=Entamoeba invadens IP1 TaxID=370355 RepID=A0A0A1U683_ENTIV|nr:rab9, putative [Entamoeba invadens IP1]ELP88395.1 rab9, putative [Entamoeba invadens IP1]|eukprot:XP_004255166.1 rab9, putative [Entamoeba invadens IP1]
MSCCGKEEKILDDKIEEKEDDVPLSEQLSKGIKVVVLGEMATGKTCILHRWVTNEFVRQTATVGCAYSSKTITYNKKLIKYEVWDAAGQERYRSLSSIYYRNATVALLVYDITRAETFSAVTDWVEELKTKAPDNVMIIIVGNKNDLETERAVNKESVTDFIKTSDPRIIANMECSAKTGDNINEIFEVISKRLLEMCNEQ